MLSSYVDIWDEGDSEIFSPNVNSKMIVYHHALLDVLIPFILSSMTKNTFTGNLKPHSTIALN